MGIIKLPVEKSIFGVCADGDPVEQVILHGGGLTLSLLSWGCVIQDLRLEGHGPPLVLGFRKFENYLAHSHYFGATAGRFANRIANARFRLNGKTYHLDRNQDGKHHLHGGQHSLARRNWRFASVAENRAMLEIDDPDGWMGYPGSCQFSAEFELTDGGLMKITYRGVTDRTTPVNLAHHSYFNLAGSGDILDHELQITADRYLPVDEDCIPLGPPLSVAGSDFDFTHPRPIRLERNGARICYDHNFCLGAEKVPMREVAILSAPSTGISLSVRTTEPGLQFYDGYKVAIPVPGLDGKNYGPCAGICLEPQHWPDAPNRHDFPDAFLRPGGVYIQETGFRFSR